MYLFILFFFLFCFFFVFTENFYRKDPVSIFVHPYFRQRIAFDTDKKKKSFLDFPVESERNTQKPYTTTLIL